MFTLVVRVHPKCGGIENEPTSYVECVFEHRRAGGIFTVLRSAESEGQLCI